MKERTFYVINLDNKRIGIILVLLAVMLSSFFLLGMSIGKKKAIAENPEKPESMEVVSEKYELPGMEKKSDFSPNPENSGLKHSDSLAAKKTEVIELNHSFKEEPLSGKNKLSASFPDSDFSKKPKISKKQSIKGTKEKIIKLAPRPAKVVRNETYTVQLGAFRNKKEAYSLKNSLVQSKKGLKPYIQKEGEMYFVRIGNSKDKKELKKIIDRLGQSLQASAMIIRSKKA
ncbi:MAG: SPOR domain-containing protein [Leptospiraceae bacterium]|nr:SPOR domain-containing protein [Leptospiraceae bacterium]MCK6382298.1 SPOR domain-containing protein [Leptospiraceae bacterium]NUM41199.1 SPOR domain-containing protein [Leptospiraceae bacterium]